MAVNRILYFYLLLLIFIFFVLFDLYLFHLLLIFLLLLPVLSLLLALPMRNAVTCRMGVEEEIVPKGRCAVTLIVENTSPLPCACVRIRLSCRNALGHVGERYTARSEEAVQLALGANRTLTLRPVLQKAACGRTDFAVKRIEVCDMLCLFRLPVPAKNIRVTESSVYVLPAPKSRVIDVDSTADIGQDSTVYSTEKPGADPSEVFALREYREGDSLHSVHWKLSYRMQRLIVREYGLPLNPSLHFLLALREGASPEAAEEMLGTALAFSEYLLSREVTHCISFLDDNGALVTASVTDANALAAVLHSLLALPGQKPWQALTSFAMEPDIRAQTHLVCCIAGAEWDAKTDAPAEQILGSLIDNGACRRITLMPDACPPEAAQSLRALGCEVQLLDGSIPGAEAEEAL